MPEPIVKYFGECAGAVVELSSIEWLPLLVHMPCDGKLVRDYGRHAVGSCSSCKAKHPARRRISYVPSSSPHVCNSLCMSARGPNCECRCGGKNHGAGFILPPSLFDDPIEAE
jgi:hypothetical protein